MQVVLEDLRRCRAQITAWLDSGSGEKAFCHPICGFYNISRLLYIDLIKELKFTLLSLLSKRGLLVWSKNLL